MGESHRKGSKLILLDSREQNSGKKIVEKHIYGSNKVAQWVENKGWGWEVLELNLTSDHS